MSVSAASFAGVICDFCSFRVTSSTRRACVECRWAMGRFECERFKTKTNYGNGNNCQPPGPFEVIQDSSSFTLEHMTKPHTTHEAAAAEWL